MKEYIQLTTAWSVLDALGGFISGDYEYDLNQLNKMGYTCDQSVYYEAHQLDAQP